MAVFFLLFLNLSLIFMMYSKWVAGCKFALSGFTHTEEIPTIGGNYARSSNWGSRHWPNNSGEWFYWPNNSGEWFTGLIIQLSYKYSDTGIPITGLNMTWLGVYGNPHIHLTYWINSKHQNWILHPQNYGGGKNF